MPDKFLVISSVNDDKKELSKIKEFIIDKYPDEYVATTDLEDVLFNYSEEFESTLKKILRTPEFINTQILSICEYTFDESTGEWLEESERTIFEKGYDVEEDQVVSQSSLTSNQYDDLPEFDDYAQMISANFGNDDQNQYNQENDNTSQFNSYDNNETNPLHNYNLSYEYVDTKTIDEIQKEDEKRYINDSNIQQQIENSRKNQSLNQDDILYDIVYDVLPTSDEIIDKLNTNLNVNDTFENPMSTVVRIIHNSTLQQLYSRVEDKIDELYNQDVDGTLDEYRQKLLDNPPKILQDLKDEVVKFRTFSQESSNDIENIRSNYEKDLERYVKEVGEKARLQAEEYARKEYIQQNENQTDNQIAEYVNSIKDTYDSMEENIDMLKGRATRTLINDFIKHGHNPALSSALRFIKDKQEIEKQAQNDIDAINQSANNAQNLQFSQPSNDEYMSVDNFEPIEDFDPNDLMISDDEDEQENTYEDHNEIMNENESNENFDDDEMDAEAIANSMNNIQNESEFESEPELDNIEEDQNKANDDDDDENNDQFEESNEEDDQEIENSKESSLEDMNEDDLNEIDDDDINIKSPEDDDRDDEKVADDAPPSEEPDTELEDKESEDLEEESDEVESLDENKNLDDETENESYLDESKGKFKKAIQGNLYDNEEDDEDDLVDQISEDQLDDKKGIESDIIDDINDVDTSKDLDQIDESGTDEKKNKKFSKIVMGFIIALVILIILALGTLFVVSQFADDSEEEKKAEQKAQAEHEKYLKDLKTYILGSDQVVQMGDQTVKVTITKVNKDGSVEAEYKDKNKDGNVVKEHTTIEKPVIQTALEKQKKQSSKKHNKTIDDEINKDNSSESK